MTSTYRSQFPLLHIDLNLDQDHQPTPFTLKEIEVATSPSHNLLCTPIIVEPSQDGGSHYYQGLSCTFQEQEVAYTNASLDGLSDPTVLKQGNYGRIKLSISKKADGVKENGGIKEDITCSSKLKSSKIKKMRKMVGSNQMGSDIRENQRDLPTPPIQKEDSNNSIVRVCADCYTTKTPLWRGGPRGPKSLCNACGIRQRKARRNMAAATGENGMVLAAKINTPGALKTKVHTKVKKVSDSNLPFKKRCKFTTSGRGRKKLSCFEDLSIILSKNSTYQQVFPQDEKEAAMLLMALSYGLVHG